MLYLLISIIGILLTIFFVVGTHEAAHFLAARLLNVKVLTFSIGFGKALVKWKDKQGTEYVIAPIPLGGYVKMLDETEGEVPKHELHLAFNRQPFYKKFLIVLAGPLTNILCAFVLYWLIFVIGFTTIRPIIGEVNPRSIAADAGLKPNQEIVGVDGSSTQTWTNVLFRLIAHVGDHNHLNITTISKPNQKPQTYTLNLANWHIDDLTPDPLSSLGIKPFAPQIPLIIGIISAKSPALSSKLKMGDKIIAVNQKPVKNWEELIKTINQHPNQTINFTVERDKKITTFPVEIGVKQSWFTQKSGYLGIGPKFKWPDEFLHKIKYGPIEALGRSFTQITDFTYFNLLLFGKLITGKISLQSLGGPITIFESAGDALNYGFLSFIAFLAFLSISIGIINLLPIPGLDGGHLFIYIVELLIGRSVPEQVLNILYRLGFLLILFVLIQALVNDLLRLY